LIAEALTCLALNIYHEARNQPLDGKIAVAHVVLNRVESPRFPDDICSVIYQGVNKGKHRCQFSWACDGKSDKPREKRAWADSQAIAASVLSLDTKDPTKGGTHYHTTASTPYWRKHLEKTRRIQDHVFYK